MESGLFSRKSWLMTSPMSKIRPPGDTCRKNESKIDDHLSQLWKFLWNWKASGDEPFRSAKAWRSFKHLTFKPGRPGKSWKMRKLSNKKALSNDRERKIPDRNFVNRNWILRFFLEHNNNQFKKIRIETRKNNFRLAEKKIMTDRLIRKFRPVKIRISKIRNLEAEICFWWVWCEVLICWYGIFFLLKNFEFNFGCKKFEIIDFRKKLFRNWLSCTSNYAVPKFIKSPPISILHNDSTSTVTRSTSSQLEQRRIVSHT